MVKKIKLGARITQARKNKGYSTSEAARMLGVSPKTLKKWENGKSVPRANRLQMMTGILGVPLAWLIGGGKQYDPLTHQPSDLEVLEQKVARMNMLHQELLQLSSEVTEEISRIAGVDTETPADETGKLH